MIVAMPKAATVVTLPEHLIFDKILPRLSEKNKAGKSEAGVKKNKAGEKKKKTEGGKNPDPKKQEKLAAQEKLKRKGKKKPEIDVEDEQPQPPPPEIVIMKIYIHCYDCARELREFLKGVDGVEHVIADHDEGKVVVKGAKAYPLELVDKIHKKTRFKVRHLLSPIPTQPEAERKKKVSFDLNKLRWIKVKKCNCKPFKFFAVKVSGLGRPYYQCDGCGKTSWVQADDRSSHV